MSTHIDYLLSRIEDPALREELAQEVGRRQFGLVFEKHLPEPVATPDVPIRRGDTVPLRAERLTAENSSLLAQATELRRPHTILEADLAASRQAYAEDMANLAEAASVTALVARR